MSGDETIDPRAAAMTEASPGALEAYLARIAQARALREQAGKGGLRFEAYLPPDLAEWLLDLIERGVFGRLRSAQRAKVGRSTAPACHPFEGVAGE
jgi:hypothetical protein